MLFNGSGSKDVLLSVNVSPAILEGVSLDVSEGEE
jgi:hypothetical protein